MNSDETAHWESVVSAAQKRLGNVSSAVPVDADAILTVGDELARLRGALATAERERDKLIAAWPDTLEFYERNDGAWAWCPPTPARTVKLFRTKAAAVRAAAGLAPAKEGT